MRKFRLLTMLPLLGYLVACSATSSQDDVTADSQDISAWSTFGNVEPTDVTATESGVAFLTVIHLENGKTTAEFGTGWWVADDTLITAAHVVYSARDNKDRVFISAITGTPDLRRLDPKQRARITSEDAQVHLTAIENPLVSVKIYPNYVHASDDKNPDVAVLKVMSNQKTASVKKFVIAKSLVETTWPKTVTALGRVRQKRAVVSLVDKLAGSTNWVFESKPFVVQPFEQDSYFLSRPKNDCYRAPSVFDASDSGGPLRDEETKQVVGLVTSGIAKAFYSGADTATNLTLPEIQQWMIDEAGVPAAVFQ